MTQYPGNPPSFGAPPTSSVMISSGAPAKTSVMAIISLVMGILGLCTGITALIGVVLGIIAIVQINRSEGRLGGRGLAIAGTIVSTVALLFTCLSIGLLLPALGKARAQAMAVKQQAQMRALHSMALTYVNENQDQFPPVDHWEEVFVKSQGDISPLISTPFDLGVRRAVAMNSKLRGKSLDDVQQPASTVLMFECQAGSPQAGAEELLPAQPRARGGYIILFVDGHVDFVKPEQLRAVRWEP